MYLELANYKGRAYSGKLTAEQTRAFWLTFASNTHNERTAKTFESLWGIAWNAAGRERGAMLDWIACEDHAFNIVVGPHSVTFTRTCARPELHLNVGTWSLTMGYECDMTANNVIYSMQDAIENPW